MTSSLIGRDDELARIVQLLDAADRLPATIAIHGEAGVGKTSLWLAGTETARNGGYTVLSSRPAEAETGFSYAGLADLLDGVVEEVLAALPPIQQRALASALLLGESEVEAGERAVAAAFLASLRTLASTAPLCVAIDDVQWLDAASLAALRFALARLEEERIATLLAVRGAPASWLRRTVPEGRITTLEVGGLSIGALHELLRARLGTGLPRPTLVRLWETSAGNPFFALELATALRRRGSVSLATDRLPIPATLDELLGERLDALGPDALRVATVVATLSEPTIGLVGSALDGATADAGLLEALDAEILQLDDDGLRFTHPLLGSAVSARQAPKARRALHRRLAAIAPTQEQRARHLAVATVRPDGAVAADLEEAATVAHARGAPLAAAELAHAAVRLTPASERSAVLRRLLFAAARYSVAGDRELTVSLLEQALECALPGRERATVLIQRAWFAATARASTELLREALSEAADDDALIAEIHLSLGPMMRFVDGVERGLEHAELAVAAASRTGDDRLRCRALASYGLLRFNAGMGIPPEEMEEALALERSFSDWPIDDGAAFVSAHQLFWSGDVDRARELLQELDVALRARGDVPGHAGALWYLALNEWRAGSWAEADRCATGSLSLAAQLGRVAVNEEFASAIVDAHLGRVDRTRARTRAAIERSREEGVLVGESGFSWVLGSLELSLGDPGAALPLLRRTHELRNATFVHEPGMRFEVGDLTEALVAVAELDEAGDVIGAVEGRAVTLDRPGALAVIARSRGLVLAARGDLDGAFAAFERALSEHARVTDPFQHARTLLALGRTQRRAKKRAAARATLEEALARFERLGAVLWAEQTRAELARIGGRTASRTELTEAERRIAVLVAQGRRNREVAAELFLTEHSVETALSRIYRKLGIRSRGELGRVLSNS